MNIAREQYEADINKAAVQALRKAAADLTPNIPPEMFDGAALHDLDTASWLYARAEKLGQK